MKTYRKTYAVHNTLLTYDIWERHQVIGWKALSGTGTPPAIFDVHAGIADVYYTGVFATFRKVMKEAYAADKQVFMKAMATYQEQLISIQATIDRGQPFKDIPSLLAFAKEFEQAWISLDLSYMTDYLDMDAAAERLSAAVREQAFGFYIGADRLIRQSLEALFPKLGAHSQYLTWDEIASQKLPSQTVLEARAEHFIYYQGQVITGVSLKEFCQSQKIRLESVYAPLRKEIRGSVGEKGTHTGKIQLLTEEIDVNKIKAGTILVASDLTPQQLAILEKASALILDEGTYYGFAASTARSLKIPCLFGTKLATMVLQTGDVLEVDAAVGVARFIEKG